MIEGGLLARYLGDALASNPMAVGSIDGTEVSAQNLLETARQIARALTAAGVAPSEPVLCTIANRPTDLAAILGIWLAGGVAVPVHASAAVATKEGIQRAATARLEVDGDRIVTVGSERLPAPNIAPDTALIVFTSGSTGRPKGVMIGHRQFEGKLRVLDRLLKIEETDTVVVPLQLTFIFGIWVSLLALGSNARLILMPRFTVQCASHLLAAGATVLAAVPTVLRAIIARPQPFAAPQLRTILTGGEAFGGQLATRVHAALPKAAIFDLYGLTETGSCDFCLPPSDLKAGLGSIGYPTEQVEYMIAAQDGEPVPPGTAGELCIRTPFGMLGYLDDPTLTSGSFLRGFFRTGDEAKLRSDGRVEIVGRLKDIVSRGGNKIAPAEIDALLQAHPDVVGALSAGVPDARLGETIHSVVVLARNSRLTGDALRAWAAERIERFKLPDVIHVRDALPTGSTGKLSRAGVVQLANNASDPFHPKGRD